jgi:peroxiredoxin
VLVYCVNDGAVMKAWSEDQGVEGSMVTFLADTRRELTEALGRSPLSWLASLSPLHHDLSYYFSFALFPGMTMTHPGPLSKLGNLRSKRFALFVDDGVIKVESVSEGPEDPAGDENPSASCVDAMLEKIKAL